MSILKFKVPSEKEKVLAEIAKQELGFETLKPRNLDSLDFRDCNVRAVEWALHLAYEAGKKNK